MDLLLRAAPGILFVVAVWLFLRRLRQPQPPRATAHDVPQHEPHGAPHREPPARAG